MYIIYQKIHFVHDLGDKFRQFRIFGQKAAGFRVISFAHDDEAGCVIVGFQYQRFGTVPLFLHKSDGDGPEMGVSVIMVVVASDALVALGGIANDL